MLYRCVHEGHFYFQELESWPLYRYPQISFPLQQGFGWDFSEADTLWFDFKDRSAFIWGFYFNKTTFTEPVTFELKMGYYKDNLYSHE